MTPLLRRLFVPLMFAVLAIANQQTTAADTKVHPGVLLVHGWASDSSVWTTVQESLDSTGLAIDLPGHGANSSEVGGWSIDRFALALEEERERRGDRCLLLVGHSNGAYVIQRYAQLFPERVAAIIVVEGTFVVPFKANDVPRIRDSIQSNWGGMRQAPPGLANAKPATQAAVMTMMARARLSTAIGTMEMLAPVSSAPVQRISAPTTFMLADSPAWTADHLRRLREIAPGSQFISLGAISHFAPLDAPVPIARTIERIRDKASCACKGKAFP